MISGINHVTWSVIDIATSFTFYVDVLGLKPIMKCSWSAYFLAGDVWIAVIQGEGRTDNRYDHIAFQVEPAGYRRLVSSLSMQSVRCGKKTKAKAIRSTSSIRPAISSSFIIPI